MIRYDANQAAFYREKLIKRVEADTRDCYQCGNCSAGCPAAFTFDYTPNQVMRMLQVGLVDRVLDSKAVQLCVQCLTCTARCPRDIDIAGIFEDLKTIATAQEREVPEYAKTFNKAFMGAVARFGQLPELYMMGMFYLGTMKPKMAMGDAGLAIPMVMKGKMQFIPRKAKGADEVSRIYKKTMERARALAKAEAKAVNAEAKAAQAEAKAAAMGAKAEIGAAAALGTKGTAGVASGSEVAE
ncbi:MAG: 4Fe-4S dicluster domain-containing protein [bacterium]